MYRFIDFCHDTQYNEPRVLHIEMVEVFETPLGRKYIAKSINHSEKSGMGTDVDEYF